MSNTENQKDHKLEAMLQSRRFESASPDLAERIVLKAQGIRQNQTVSLMQWMKQLFADFHLPRPAYVLAGTLIFGAVVGFNTSLGTTPADNGDSMYVQSFLYADESLL
ncbi:MAG: hypothetical protein ACRERD_02675 [Candidatus Binatia bacterium]